MWWASVTIYLFFQLFLAIIPCLTPVSTDNHMQHTPYGPKVQDFSPMIAC